MKVQNHDKTWLLEHYTLKTSNIQCKHCDENVTYKKTRLKKKLKEHLLNKHGIDKFNMEDNVEEIIQNIRSENIEDEDTLSDNRGSTYIINVISTDINDRHEMHELETVHSDHLTTNQCTYTDQ